VATFSGSDLRTGLTLLAKYGLTRARAEFFDITLSAHPKGLKVHFAETSDLADVREFVTDSVLSGLFTAITLFVGPGRLNAIVSGAASDTSVGPADMVSQLLRENPGRL
jgi:hypothetical protein